jgi:hypothetical protein
LGHCYGLQLICHFLGGRAAFTRAPDSLPGCPAKRRCG